MFPLLFDKKLLLRLTAGFVFTIAVGTVFINLCVFTAANHLNFNPVKYYGYKVYIHDSLTDKYHSCDTIGKYYPEIRARKDFPAKASLIEFSKKIQYNSSFLGLSAVFPIMLIGSIGFVLLLFRRRSSEYKIKLYNSQWILVFLSLFWVPVSMPLIAVLVHLLFNVKLGLMHIWEYPAVNVFHLPEWLLVTVTGLISWTILFIVIFRIVPLKQRATFVLAGICTGILFMVIQKAVVFFPGVM